MKGAVIIATIFGWITGLCCFIYNRFRPLCITLGIAVLYYQVRLIQTNMFEPTFNEFLIFFLLYEFTSIKHMFLANYDSTSGFYLYCMAQMDKNWGYMSTEEIVASPALV
jgi:hypothetical protein